MNDKTNKITIDGEEYNFTLIESGVPAVSFGETFRIMMKTLTYPDIKPETDLTFTIGEPADGLFLRPKAMMQVESVSTEGTLVPLLVMQLEPEGELANIIKLYQAQTKGEA